ncbi:MAG: flavin reductase family protein [Clostridiales bacterium]|nr:flavin reductase family protein [Clostridiales bacterium]
MSRIVWKPGNMVYPVPPVLVTCRYQDQDDVMTAAWTGTICSEPPMCYVSIRKERFSHDLIENSGCFAINLPCRALRRAVDYCGVKSGREENKFETAHLLIEDGTGLDLPILTESPVNIECRVTQILRLGSHDMFIGKVEAVDIDPALLDEQGRFHMEQAGLLAYSHGTYYELGKAIGTFGWTVRKPKKKKPRRNS